MSDMAIEPGDLVTPSKKIIYEGDGDKSLYLWKDFDNLSDDVTDKVALGDLLIVVETKNVNFEYPTKGWDLCVKVLTSQGSVGWTGSGWIKKVSPSTMNR